MIVYLVQHAKSKSEEEDPLRPLSDQGLNDAAKVASFLKHIKVNKVYHSGKLRSQQTAEIFAKSLNCEILMADGLEPMADPSISVKRIEKEAGDIMIVGHLPHLGRLASLLLSNTQEKNVISFQQGGVVCLEKNDRWSVCWMITPEFLGQL